MVRTVGWLALGCALLGRSGLAQGEGPVSARWAFDPGGSVRIMNPYGQIRVIGWDVDSLAVLGRLEAKAGRFYAAGDPRVRKLGVEVPVEQRDAGKADLEVRVPRRAALWVKTATADIAVEGVDGTLDLNSVSGTIHVVGTPQDVTAETMDGAVEIAGGTGRVRVKTVSGAILLRGASDRGGVVELETQSGKLDVRVPATTIADFDLLTIGGTITNTLTAAAPQRRAAGVGQELRLSTGTGGAQVTVRSFKGPILLEPK